ncbi:unnamed protein product [Brassica oleracea var. botrytis]
MAEAAPTEASSLVGKLETEVEIKASAGKFHHMFAGRPHHVSKASPGNIQGCDLHEGDWGKVGSIVYWNYIHGKSTSYTFFLIIIGFLLNRNFLSLIYHVCGMPLSISCSAIYKAFCLA